MAEVKQNGVVVNPSTGSGNTTLQVKAEVANRGNRLAQTATFEVEGSGVAEKKQFVANHLQLQSSLGLIMLARQLIRVVVV